MPLCTCVFLSPSQVTYGFAEGTTSSIESTFSLDRVTGLLELLVQVDFDSGLTSYDFSVVAMDRGSPAMTSTADVRSGMLIT